MVLVRHRPLVNFPYMVLGHSPGTCTPPRARSPDDGDCCLRAPLQSLDSGVHPVRTKGAKVPRRGTSNLGTADLDGTFEHTRDAEIAQLHNLRGMLQPSIG